MIKVYQSSIYRNYTYLTNYFFTTFSEELREKAIKKVSLYFAWVIEKVYPYKNIEWKTIYSFNLVSWKLRKWIKISFENHLSIENWLNKNLVW